MAPTALITGIAGQDGAYLSRLLLERGYTVVGGARSARAADTRRLETLGVAGHVTVVDFDLADVASLPPRLAEIRPDEVYNLAAQSDVAHSFRAPFETAQVNGQAVAHLLEALYRARPEVRFYQASSSTMFGRAGAGPQTEATPIAPQSPYAAAKAYAHWLTAMYRDAYGMFACAGILFNHESPLRGLNFVMRKVTSTLARIKAGAEPGLVLQLGNLDARRDWGFAGDYVDGIWRMLHHHAAADYVLATGEPRSVRELVAVAGAVLGIDIEWSGTGADEVGRDRRSGRVVVKVDQALFRPLDSAVSYGDAGKARRDLGWKPTVSFERLVAMMVEADYDLARRGVFARGGPGE